VSIALGLIGFAAFWFFLAMLCERWSILPIIAVLIVAGVLS